MSSFKNIFQFLEIYGGTKFISDLNKSNYNEEKYRDITNLKIAAYDEFWKEIFSQISPYLKDRESKQIYKIQNWQDNGNIYDYFEIQIKDKEKLNYGSNISITATKDKVDIKIDYDYINEVNKNGIINHNKYILNLDKWKEIYNVHLDRYYLFYEEESNMNKISLNDFMKNEDLKSYIVEKIKSSEECRVVVGKEFDKNYVLDSNIFQLEIAQSINELNFLYEKAIDDYLK